MNRLWRIPASVVIALAVVIVTASPASAHSVSGQGATNFKTKVDAISPPVPGLSVKIVELGSRIQLTWTGPDDLVVEGYSGEPYLRVGPDGVFENRRSPSTYINATRFNPPAPPPDASTDPKTPPDWHKIGSGRTVLWHDHRAHFMGGVLPPQIRRAPGSFHKVQDWTITAVEGTRTIAVAGEYDWVPGSSSVPWVLLLVVLAVLGTLAGLTKRWTALLAALTGVLIAADAIHAIGIGAAAAGSTGHRVLIVLGGSYYSIVAWVLGVVAIRMLARKSVDGLFAAIFAGLVIGLFGGLTDIGWLWHSQVPFSFGAAFGRFLVAASVGGAAGLVAGSIIAFRRNRPAPAGRPVAAPDAAA